MSKIGMMVEELERLKGYSDAIGGTPEEFFQHMQGHRTELSLVLTALDIANNLTETLVVLKEHEKNLKVQQECVWCQGDVDGRDYLIGDGGVGIYIDGNGYLIADDQLNMDEIKIYFCPICGRRLNQTK